MPCALQDFGHRQPKEQKSHDGKPKQPQPASKKLDYVFHEILRSA